MMNKDKTTPVKRLKLLWALPVIALLLVSFAKPNYVSGENPNTVVGADEKTITVTGKVTDENGKPLPGTSIVVKNSSTGAISDAKGNYTLAGIKPDDEIVFSFVGYGTKVVNAANKLNVSLSKEVFVIGYASNQMAPPPPPPPPSPFAIRSKDGGKPLFVIDGNSNVDPNTIDPNTISSIEVLKDQSAIATYGDKGKDGVILITSKKGNMPPPPANNEVFVIVEEMPQFPGGQEALIQYLKEESRKSKIKGSAFAQFTVQKDGSIENVRVFETTSAEVTAESIKIIKGMPKWKPGKQRGVPVNVDYTVPMVF